jgi:putative transcriptional regulator
VVCLLRRRFEFSRYAFVSNRIIITFMKSFITPQKLTKGSLAGNLLIATSVVQDSCFERSVIYLSSHSDEGAMGMIINYPVEKVEMKDILDQLDIDSQIKLREFPIHFGGPVEANRGFVVHSSDYVANDSMSEENGIVVTANVSVLQELAQGKGPDQGMLVLGYAGWSAGQLESEIELGSWIVVPASKKLVFDTDNEIKWNVAIATLGFDMGHYSTTVGHA